VLDFLKRPEPLHSSTSQFVLRNNMKLTELQTFHDTVEQQGRRRREYTLLLFNRRLQNAENGGKKSICQQVKTGNASTLTLALALFLELQACYRLIKLLKTDVQ